jgi:hypothetical protein
MIEIEKKGGKGEGSLEVDVSKSKFDYFRAREGVTWTQSRPNHPVFKPLYCRDIEKCDGVNSKL